MTWKELVRDRYRQKVFFILPQYQLSNGFFMNAETLCLAGENQDIIEPIGKKERKVCADHGNDGPCRRYKVVYPKIAVEGTRFGCLEWQDRGDDRRCVQYGQVPYKYTTELDVKVTKHTKRSEGRFDRENYGRFLFNKVFSMPACSEIE